MKMLSPGEDLYAKVVNITDSKNYTLDMQLLESNQGITCPFDKNMKVGKDEHGNIILTKKTFSFISPFTSPFKTKN